MGAGASVSLPGLQMPSLLASLFMFYASCLKISVEEFTNLGEEEKKVYEEKFKELTDAGKTGEEAVAELVRKKNSIKRIELQQLIEAIDLAISEGKTPLVTRKNNLICILYVVTIYILGS